MFYRLRDFISCSPVLCSAAILLVVVLGAIYFINRPKALNLPIVGTKGQAYYGDTVLEGVSKVASLPLRPYNTNSISTPTHPS
jgi:hypothetical protein